MPKLKLLVITTKFLKPNFPVDPHDPHDHAVVVTVNLALFNFFLGCLFVYCLFLRFLSPFLDVTHNSIRGCVRPSDGRAVRNAFARAETRCRATYFVFTNFFVLFVQVCTRGRRTTPTTGERRHWRSAPNTATAADTSPASPLLSCSTEE